MVSCLVAGNYTMYADVWRQEQVINPETGQPERSWVFQKTISCHAFPYLEQSARSTSTTEQFGDRYANSEYLKLKSSYELDKRCRITNIRFKHGRIIYQESLEGKPTIYNVDGSVPMANPLSKDIDEWLSTISRAVMQE